ncbi:MAG: hypothetical protein Q4D27_05055 [Coriobacteriia bacterium]|nr:hypothetical protein [Coriobacteriia bacterium]
MAVFLLQEYGQFCGIRKRMRTEPEAAGAEASDETIPNTYRTLLTHE